MDGLMQKVRNMCRLVADGHHDRRATAMKGLCSREPCTGTVEIPREPAASTYWLDIHERSETRAVTIADGSKLVFGSRAPSDVILDDPTVSSVHCRVRCEKGRLFVEDAGSRNGVFVGSARVQRAELGPGAFFVLGRVSVTVRSKDDVVSSQEAEPPIPGLIGSSPCMLDLGRQVRRLAQLSMPVVVRGETGTGKELVARALHSLGPRASKPFVAVNAAALPRDLAEDELFGHERGAFTGAHARRLGAFLEAQGGTLFLDEVGELDLDVQVKLLRVLEQREVRPLGGAVTYAVDVRLVAATWSPLEHMIQEGKFREDLYHRLAVATVSVPPLRERRGDIAALAEHFLRDRQEELGPKSLSSRALACLMAAPWSGNVRELRNVMTRAAVISSGEVIGTSDIAKAMQEQPAVRTRMTAQAARALVIASDGNIARAARRCGVPRSTFRGWLGES
jgi:transcriptional regulator with PAS, ATPase and Fis domain